MSESINSSLYDFKLPDNSHQNRNEIKTKPKQEVEGKRAEKIIHGTVKTRKNGGRNFLDTFLAEDGPNIWNYIKYEVLVPSLKRGFYDIIVGSLDMGLYGGRSNNGKRPTADKVSYRDYNGVSRRDTRDDRSRSSSSRYSYDDIVLETRGEAEAVLARMDEIMEEYEIVRVADMYDLVGITGEHTDNKYGWTDIRNASIERTRDGDYRIKMPRALPIRR